jgi:hypothetical protein
MSDKKKLIIKKCLVDWIVNQKILSWLAIR